MEIIDLYPGGFASSCYLLIKDGDAVLIDCSAPVSTVREALTPSGATLRAILCTHGHFDHVLTVCGRPSACRCSSKRRMRRC